MTLSALGIDYKNKVTLGREEEARRSWGHLRCQWARHRMGLAPCAGLSRGGGLEEREWLSTYVSEVSSGQTQHGTWEPRLVAGTQHPGESTSGLKGQAEGRGHGRDPPEAYAEGAQARGDWAEPERKTPFRGTGPQKNGEALGGDCTLTAPRMLPSPDPGSKPTPQPPPAGARPSTPHLCLLATFCSACKSWSWF